MEFPQENCGCFIFRAIYGGYHNEFENAICRRGWMDAVGES
jgi:hypothetical protein